MSALPLRGTVIRCDATPGSTCDAEASGAYAYVIRRKLHAAGWTEPARGVDRCPACTAAWAATTDREATDA